MTQSIADLIGVYLAFNRAKSPHTVRTYATGLSVFQAHLREAGLNPAEAGVDALSERTPERFYFWLLDRRGGAAPATAHTYLSGLRGFMRYLAAEGLIAHISLERTLARLARVIAPPRPRAPRIVAGLAGVVLAANRAPLTGLDPYSRLALLRDRAILNALFCTGMRRGELAAMNRADVESGLPGQALITGKGRKERVVFFDEATLGHIAAYLAERWDCAPALLVTHRLGRAEARLSMQSIWLTVKRYAARAGVDASPHDFRHLKATTLLNRGADLSHVQDLLGHASPETTKSIYAHYSVDHLRQAFDQFSRPLEAG